jgi:DNA-binding LytR/AlgR family response regulator
MKRDLTSKMPFTIGLNIRARLRSPFPYYLNDDRKNLILSAGIGIFVILFMPLYKPYHNFDEHLEFPIICLFGAITFIVLVLSIIMLPKIFPEAFDPLHWNLQKYLTQVFLHCTIIGFASAYVDKLLVCPDKPFGDILIHAYTQVALIGIIPVTVITLFLKNNMLQENLRNAIITNRELEKIRTLKDETDNSRNHTITLFSDTSETLNFNLPDLLFIEADDNYSTIHWRTDEGVQKKLLRANLKNIESQIDNSFTIRCHRSYMVNIHAICSITGNTNGYKLKIKNTEHFIPVSRPKGKEVMEKISQLKNMMELY